MEQKKTVILDTILSGLGSFVVAFSGGLDSSYLVYHAGRLKSIRFIAVTIRTPYMPAREINEAAEFAAANDVDHKIIDISFPEAIRHNPADRCYICKKMLFSHLAGFACDNGFRHIVDGTNSDDKNEYRPGLRALQELEVRSPLAEAGLSKKEIRELCRNAGLKIWDKPAMSCLLTRIPYETEITGTMIRMIEEAEELLFRKGYPGARVRAHNDIARIELLPGYSEKIILDPEKNSIIDELKKIGFRYISLDLEGYRTGSMNTEQK
jgi:uncharacterized protein